MRPIVRVENLSKRYRIGAQKVSYDTVGEKLAGALRAPFRRRDGDSSAETTLWALKDVNFEVMPGEVLGVIGHNGAGKSTLLKVLSRITEPTSGRVKLYGRIGSLLEVGTGFHPELTGRENIYLNGAIMGMHRSEIEDKFDEIVAFAGVDKFLDTPVKRYSSGMYVRLAFGVAAHLDPEILLIDEVLAVGDLEFQKKCLGKMQEFAKGGRTVLFVSHNMSAVSSLCSRVLIMEQGKVAFAGPVEAGISRYVLNTAQTAEVDLSQTQARQGPGEFARISKLSVCDRNGQLCDVFPMGQPLVAHLEVVCKKRLRNAEVGFALANQVGTVLHYFVSTWEGLQGDLEEGTHRFEITVPEMRMYPGVYILIPWVKRQGESVDDEVDAALSIAVIGADITGHRPYFERYRQSGCETYAPSEWRLQVTPRV